MISSRVYGIELTRTAEKTLARLEKKPQVRVLKAIRGLREEPRPSGCRKLAGYDHVYRIRTGEYRIVYEVHDHHIVVIVLKIGHRRDVYKGL